MKIPKTKILIILFLISALAAFFYFYIKSNEAHKWTGESLSASRPENYQNKQEIKWGEYALSFRPREARASKMEKGGENIFKYADIFEKTDIVQTKTATKLKEDIILKAAGHPLEFSYELDAKGLAAAKDKDGNLVFYKSGHQGNDLYKIFTIPAPYLKDADGKISPDGEAEMTFKNNVLNIKIKNDWLKQAKYPVVLDPTIELNILNIHSHPRTAEYWTVSFTTAGTGDLKIIPNDQPTIDDDEFIGLYCGEKKLTPQILPGDVIFYPNWECEETAKVVHYTARSGNHTLRFDFGGIIGWAYNSGPDGYLYKRTITINESQVTGSSNLTDFPALVSLSEAELKTTTNGGHVRNDSGYDIVFASDSAGTALLDHEIEGYASTTGATTMWVRIPTLSYDTNTVIYMFYGNPNISVSSENKTGVWGNNYAGVWHLEETDIDGGAGDIKDSTVNANNGASANMDTADQVAGKIGGGFDFDGANDAVSVADADSLDLGSTGAIEAWMKTDDISTQETNFSSWTSRNAPNGAGADDQSGQDSVIVGETIHYGALLCTDATEDFGYSTSSLSGATFKNWDLTTFTAPNGCAASEGGLLGMDSDGVNIYYAALAVNGGTSAQFWTASATPNYTSVSAWRDESDPTGSNANEGSGIDMVIVGNTAYYDAVVLGTATENVATTSRTLGSGAAMTWQQSGAVNFGGAANENCSISVDSDGAMLYRGILCDNAGTEMYKMASSTVGAISALTWRTQTAPGGSGTADFNDLDIAAMGGQIYHAAGLHAAAAETYQTASSSMASGGTLSWVSRQDGSGNPNGMGAVAGDSMTVSVASDGKNNYYGGFIASATVEAFFTASSSLPAHPFVSKFNAYEAIQVGTGLAFDWAGRPYTFGTSTDTSGYDHVVITQDGTTLNMYENGVLKRSQTTSVDFEANANALLIGGGTRSDGSPIFFNGIIDEVRVSTSTKSADWIATEYNNQNSTSTFYTLGSEGSTLDPAEFVSVVDPGGTGDYSSLSAWNTGVATDLTASSTLLYSGTTTGAVGDNASVTLYRGGASQSVTATVVHNTSTTSSQLLLENVSNPIYTFQIYDQWRVNSTNYVSLSTSTINTAIAVATCRTTNSEPDTAAVTIENWVTSATNYIKIWTDPSEPYRHEGKWDEGKYRIETSNSSQIRIDSGGEFVTIDGLQFKSAHSANNQHGLLIMPGSGAEIRISNNIIKGELSGAADSDTGIDASFTGTFKAWNNIVYGWKNGNNLYPTGIWADVGGSSYLYNNTISDCHNGIYNNKQDITIAKNNLSYDNAVDYAEYVFNSASTNNLSKDNTAPDFGVSYPNATVIFEDEANDDFHLDSSDIGAKNQGTIIYDSGDDATLNFTTDVDNNSRLDSAGTWDIGADENIARVYASVGPGATTAITSGTANNHTNHMTLSGITATFELPLPDNVGVGDAIQYDSDNNGSIDSAMLIDKRYSSQKYRVKITNGIAPNAMAVPDIDWSVFRVSTSLNNAITGTPNSGIDAGALGQDLVSTTNLPSIQVQLNIPCYANGTTADTAAVTVDGWTTSADSYIKIYTPTRSDEVGASERHSGKWDTSKYKLEVAGSASVATYGIFLSDNHIRVEGLQIRITSVASSFGTHGISFGGSGASPRYYISNNIIRGYASNTYSYHTGILVGSATAASDGIVRAWNNIFYDWQDDGADTTIRAMAITDADSTLYAYNNTAQNCRVGFLRSAGTFVAINNLAKGISTAAYSGTFSSSSGYNIGYDTTVAFGSTVDSGNTDGIGGSTSVLRDTGQNFQTTVKVGMVVVNTTDVTGSYVTGVNSDTELSLANDIMDDGENYVIYSNMYGEPTFADETNDDFHLSPSDTVAKNKGFDLTNDLNLNFNTDIDDAIPPFQGGNVGGSGSRPYNTSWDIGADEVITPIYRSVAPEADGNLAALATGASNHLNISGSTATFDSALPDNVGVGDALEYDDDNNGTIDGSDSIAFITARTSSTVYTIKTATGGVPTAPSAADEIHWNINRAYTSLSYAEAGTENENIDSELRNFDAGNRDIASNSEQWYFACYANGTAADETAVTINGWTTAPQNYIKVYTPVYTSEVGISQRHQGKWDDGRYNLSVTGSSALINYTDYVRIDGLQVYSSSGQGIQNSLGSGSASRTQIESNIVKGNASVNVAIYIQDSGATGGVVDLYNNIIYDQANSYAMWIRPASFTSYVYNNTIIGCAYGIYVDDGTVIAKNNIVKGSGDTNAYTGTFASGTDYNATDGTDDIGTGLNDRISQTFTFLDATNKDFHLSPSDTGAKDYGVDLSQDPVWQEMAANDWIPASAGMTGGNDIDGSNRPNAGSGLNYDIGADEVSTPIYRSIAPSNTSDLNTDSRTVSVSNNTAIFSGAMPDSVGVGDAIQYDSDGNSSIDAVAFITGRTSSTTYSVTSATGGTPAHTPYPATFPTTSVLDDFGRGDEGPPMTGWTDIYNGIKVVSGAAEGNIADYNESFYNSATYGPDSEAYVTLSNDDASADFYLTARLDEISSKGYIVYMSDVAAGTDDVVIFRFDNGNWTFLGAVSQEFSNGDSLGMRVVGNTISAYYKPSAGSWTLLGSISDSTYAEAGYIGLGEGHDGVSSAVIDDFGGGSIINDYETANVYRAYTSLASAEAGIENTGLTDTVQNFDDWTTGGAIGDDEVGRDIWTNNEQWNIAAYANGTTADGAMGTIDGWTTASTNYLNVYTPTETTEVGTSQRHSGKWDDSKYHIVTSDGGYAFIVLLNNLRIDGIQIKLINSGDNYRNAIYNSPLESKPADIQISNNIIQGVISGTSNNTAGILFTETPAGSTAKLWNNIIYGFRNGANTIMGIWFYNDTWTSYAYNNTIYDSYYGYVTYTDHTIAKNNIAQNCTDGFFGTFGGGSDYNISDVASDAPNATYTAGNSAVEVKFTDSAGKDFHLDPTDIAARNMGADLSADTALAITTDIDGKTRPNQGAFDIGADEAAKGVYYSVGQNVTDHGSGGTLTIEDGIATFTVAQTAANLGVGDKVTYNTSSIAYLLRKVDTTHWYIITATGAIPADDATPRSVDTITHAFNALAEAEDHADDADYMNATDLSANDFQLNIPCYNDAGAADTTAVTIDGYTTSPNNFIKIYTPVDTSTEANTRQRHWGKWDDGKYKLQGSDWDDVLQIDDSNIKIIGLQIYSTTNSYDNIETGNTATDVEIAYNIIRNARDSGLYVQAGPANIYNNIIYNSAVHGVILWGPDDNCKVYNNTIAGSGNAGIDLFYANNNYIKNNLLQDNTGDDFQNEYSTVGSNTANNITSDGSSPNSGSTDCGGHYCTNQTVAFSDATNKDYHLAGADTVARNSGVSLVTDDRLPFNTDIDGNGRSLWDIGADEGSVEMDATVMQTGGDYSSLSGWETGMGTDLVSPTTMVFAGTKKLDILDNADVTLYRGGNSQGVTADVVHASDTQILLENISNPSYVMAANDVWQVDGSNYFTISTAGGDPASAVAKIDGAWSAPDTSTVAISGWETGPTNYVKVYTTAAARHSGKWDEGKYRLEVTNGSVLMVYASFAYIDGLQIKVIINSDNWYSVVALDPTDVGGYQNISNNIVQAETNIKPQMIYGIVPGYFPDYGRRTYNIWNNVIYGMDESAGGYVGGIVSFSGNNVIHAYSNTVSDCYNGIEANSANTFVVKNNISYNNTTDYSGTFDASSTNNLSKDGTAPPHNTYYTGATVSFVNANKKDFHLAQDDTAARNTGADLSTDDQLPMTDDIDGSTRTDVWDIGADEGATAVYYSVGQNTSNHCGPAGDGNSCGNVSITSGAATFTAAQAGTNLGIGDALVAGGNTYYLSQKNNSNTSWNVITALGATPANLGSTAVTSISHAADSLEGMIDVNGGWVFVEATLDTTDLVAGNYVLNIPCYYDTGPDQTAVVVSGLTTSAQNYIKIYAPNDTTKEVNQTQRHSGKWDDGKYKLEITDNVALSIQVDYAEVSGIQIKLTRSTDVGYGIDVSSLNANNLIKISNNIIKGVFSGGDYHYGIYVNDSDAITKVWNNIIYGFVQGTDPYNIGIRGYQGIIYAYNNTVYDSRMCYAGDNTSVIYAKNNIAQNCNDGYAGTFDSSSDYNISDHADTPGSPGTHNKNSTTVTFIDETNKDFHLAFADTGAKGYGTNLKDDAYLAFQNDIDGQERTGNWTIGADEPREAEIQSATQKAESITDGLVLYQSFDGMDISGNNSADSSGNGNNGTISGATPARGKKGQALLFNGSSYISIPNISSGTITISIWAKTSSATLQPLLFYDTENNQFRINSNGFVRFLTNSANDIDILTSGVNVIDGNWHHIVAVNNGTNAFIYIDGIQRANGAGSANSRIWNIIGKDSDSNYFNGSLDEVRVYNRALSEAEVGDLYRLGGMEINTSQINNNKSGLVGMWSFDGPDVDLGTNTAYDRSGSNNNGTIHGAEAARGKKGQGLDFTSAYSDYVDLGTDDQYDFVNTSFTASLWLKTTSSDYQIPLANNLGSGGGWGIEMEETSGKIAAEMKSSAGGDICESYTPLAYNDGEWHNITAIFTTNTATANQNITTIYIDGAFIQTTVNSSGLAYPASPSTFNYIGRRSAGNYFNGSLDEVRIYNTALTPAQIGDLYRMGTAEVRR